MRNDLIFNLASTLNCYEPVHGYKNEKMDFSQFSFNEIKNFLEVNILLGDPYEEKNGMLNFYEPSCFLFPRENNCKPYDHFKINQLENLKNLIQEEKYIYNYPVLNLVIIYINLITLLCLFAYLFLILFKIYLKR